ncbi:MAG: bifunctional methylenetetrahydrofolate dehydrogenase/methenyltetrahydrofolate cyclohydrolase FolD [Alphaproteobacteria bacterium]|nr:bifunctional methylenetetrahydrofolate dehydrogenase/methenyltetrahydrofolate cyclohydrolase FolD [Alphaproteobacteria bacterium]
MSSANAGDFLKLTSAKALAIDGKAVSAHLLEQAAAGARELIAKGVRPGLAVVLVGSDPASQVYVGAKGKAANQCGFHSEQHTLPVETSETDLLALVERLNRDPAIHGILVQLPLPAQIDSQRVLEAIDPAKDVDGFHPVNAGLLATGALERALVPCTPAGSMILLREAAKALGRKLAGSDAIVVGRSNIVGKPMAQLLLAENCTVTIAHSRTGDLGAAVGRADIVVAAVGRAEMIRGEWLKPGAIVIDVGISRVPGEGLNAQGQPKTRLVGDVHYASALERAAAITPVPGGVGPMTIAMLMMNTLTAAQRKAK